jgi:hypothetical protein
MFPFIMKSDRHRRLKSIEYNLKSQPEQFFKYVASVRKIISSSIQFDTDRTHLAQPCEVADELAKYFQSVYSNPCPEAFPITSLSFDF